MYSPVKSSKASGGSGEYVIHGGGVPPRDSATKLAMTVTVKTIDIHRWICRIHAFQLNETSVH